MTNKLSIVGTEAYSNDFEKIKNFLQQEGIAFGRFQLHEKTLNLIAPNSLTEEDRQSVLLSYPELEKKYSQLEGYKSDVVCLYPEFEHLAFIMEKFGDVHYHFENEYWYFIDGRLGFVFYSPKGFKFRVVVEAGEYIQVPEGCWQQCFFVAKTDRMKSMRFFNTTNSIKLPNVHL